MATTNGKKESGVLFKMQMKSMKKSSVVRCI